MAITTDNLTQAHKEFLQFLEEKGRASATILAYGSDLQQLIDFAKTKGKNKASDINPQDLKEFKKHLSQEGYTPKSISRKINSTRTFFKILVKHKILATNPATNLTHPKYEVKPPRVLSKMEYMALRDAARHDVRMSAIIELFLQTGIRIGELAGLKLEDIKDEVITIKAYESQPEREVPLNKAAKQAIDDYLKQRPKSKSDVLFLTKSGRPFLIRNIRSAVNRFFKLAGIKDATVNDLRHTFIVQQLKAGVPLVLVSQLVGHKRLSTTEKYLKLIRQKSADKMKIKEL